MSTYAYKKDIIANEITGPLGEYADQYDIEAIADEIIQVEYTANYPIFTIRENIDFWDIVEANAL